MLIVIICMNIITLIILNIYINTNFKYKKFINWFLNIYIYIYISIKIVSYYKIIT